MGKPIYPGRESRPPVGTNSTSINQVPNGSSNAIDQQVDEMFAKYCEEMIRIFDRHKESYGWAHKTLKLINR